MNRVNIPRARRYPLKPIVRPVDWREIAARWVQVKRPTFEVTNEQFAVAE